MSKKNLALELFQRSLLENSEYVTYRSTENTESFWKAQILLGKRLYFSLRITFWKKKDFFLCTKNWTPTLFVPVFSRLWICLDRLRYRLRNSRRNPCPFLSYCIHLLFASSCIGKLHLFGLDFVVENSLSLFKTLFRYLLLLFLGL